MITTIVSQGLIFSLIAMAVFCTSRVLKKDDLTVEGSFGLAAALSALLLERGYPAPLVIALALVAGAASGLTSGLLHCFVRINHLMAGLVTTTACFSLALFSASAHKNVAQNQTIFAWAHADTALGTALFLFFLIAVSFVLLKCFFATEIGLLVRAAGDNPSFLKSLAKSEKLYQIIGFMLANALTGLAGSLFVQWSGYFSISANVGSLVTGLSSLMIMELFKKGLSFMIIAAAVLYQTLFAICLYVGIEPLWNNLMKALFIVAIVIISRLNQIRELSHA
jgi:putative ABC transport system permease protein